MAPSIEPDRDVSGWIEFCVDAHLAQARQRSRPGRGRGRPLDALEELVDERHWPDRLVIALEQALMGGSDRAGYATEADISPATASADFRRLLDAGLIDQRGRGRSVRYLAGDNLRGKTDKATAQSVIEPSSLAFCAANSSSVRMPWAFSSPSSLSWSIVDWLACGGCAGRPPGARAPVALLPAAPSARPGGARRGC